MFTSFSSDIIKWQVFSEKNALLDCGADPFLVTEDIAKILQLKGEQKPLKI